MATTTTATAPDTLNTVVFDLNVDDQQDMTCHALLDYLTNHKNVTNVLYKKRNYLLNQSQPIQLDDHYFATLLSTTKDVHSVEIGTKTHTTQDIRKFVEKIVYNYGLTVQNKLEKNMKYFFSMVPVKAPVSFVQNDVTNRPEEIKNYSKLPPNMEFTMKPFMTNRRFDNLFGEDMVTIRERVNFFTKNKKWYDNKGIPYTLGLLLSGPPGTGKTSTIKCIANETNRHIININFNNDITKQQVENLFASETIILQNNNNNMNQKNQCPQQLLIPCDQRLYVLEDIDCQFADRADTATAATTSNNMKIQEQHQQTIDLSFMLNLLDGVLENPGRIIIMTSNYPERLDHALIRPGRIDVMAKLDLCTTSTIVSMFEFFFEMKLNPKQKHLINRLPQRCISPAELSRIMFENMCNMKNAIISLCSYVESRQQQQQWQLMDGNIGLNDMDVITEPPSTKEELS